MFYYQLKCKDEKVTETYVGKTKGTLKKRMSGHKTICNLKQHRYKQPKLYNYIRSNGGIENWEIILLEENSSTNETGIEMEWINKCNARLNYNLLIDYRSNQISGGSIRK